MAVVLPKDHVRRASLLVLLVLICVAVIATAALTAAVVGRSNALSQLSAEEVLTRHIGARRDHDLVGILATTTSERWSLNLIRHLEVPGVVDLVPAPGASEALCEFEVAFDGEYPGGYSAQGGVTACRFVLRKSGPRGSWRVTDWGL